MTTAASAEMTRQKLPGQNCLVRERIDPLFVLDEVLGDVFSGIGAIGDCRRDLVKLLGAYVARRVDARHARLPHRVGDNVAGAIKLDGIVQELDVGHGADGDEERRTRDIRLLARDHVLELESRNREILANDFLNGRVPDDLDVVELLELDVVNGRGAQHVTAYDDRHLIADAREVDRIRDGRIAATDDTDVLALEKVAIAGSAIRDTRALELFLARNAEQGRPDARWAMMTVFAVKSSPDAI